MHRVALFISFLLLCGTCKVRSAAEDSTEVFLLTCLPGRTIVTIYGHSAIRIVNRSMGSDKVYNWGVYDFHTPHFAWKFARGRLKYELEEITYNSFIAEYSSEQRRVISQKINLNVSEIRHLSELIEINLLAENKQYLYDFFLDNCSTRIRDLLEKVLSNKIVYPHAGGEKEPTFRQQLHKVQKSMPWLNFGNDLLIGLKGDKKASFRDQMFLPQDLMRNLSLARINIDWRLLPILQEPKQILIFPELPYHIVFQPVLAFSLIFLVVVILSVLFGQGKISIYMDSILFGIASLVSILLVFFSFYSDQVEMKANLNLLLFSPFLLMVFFGLLCRRKIKNWARISFVCISVYIFSILIIVHSVNLTFFPIAGILIFRTYIRGFHVDKHNL